MTTATSDALRTELTPQEMEDILRTAYPTVDKGTTKEIPAELIEAYQQAQQARDQAKAALAAWDLHVTALNVHIRRHLESAQTATDAEGKPVCARRMYHQEEYIVPARDVDGIWRASRK